MKTLSFRCALGMVSTGAILIPLLVQQQFLQHAHTAPPASPLKSSLERSSMNNTTSVQKNVVTCQATKWRSFDAFRLSDGKTEAIVVPDLSGRVMHYGQIGGVNWLWNAQPERVQSDGFRNWGGDKTFIGPHGVWQNFAKNIWPPNPGWDGPKHQAQVLDGGRLRTTSPAWSGFGTQVVREFGFNGNGEFVITQRLQKTEGEPRLLSIWNVAQAAPPEAVYMPLNVQSVYKQGFHSFGELSPDAKVQRLSPSLLHIEPKPGVAYKLGADAPVASLAAVRNGMVWLLRADKLEGEFPEGAAGSGFPIEYYNHGEGGAGQYVELEFLSPYYQFTTDENPSTPLLTVRWSLHSLKDKSAVSPTTQQEVEKLLQSQ